MNGPRTWPVTRPRVLVVGGIGVDDIVYLAGQLIAGAYIEAQPEERSPAGAAATVATALAGAGVHTALAGAVGLDAAGDWLCQTLTTASVEQHICRIPGPSPRSLVLVEPSGERTIIGITPDLMEHAITALSPDALPDSTGTLVIPSWRPQFSGVLRVAQDRGARTIVGLRALVEPHVSAHFAVGSEHELGDVNPNVALDRFGTVVVTVGDRGAYALTSGRCINVEPVRVDALDATGAGDAFLAGLVVALTDNEPLEQALRLAAAWGAAAVAQRGTRPPTLQQARRLWDETR